MKKTKIVCTIGPASDSEEILRALFKAGLNVCRLNFSHGTHEEHRIRIDRIKKIRQELNLPVAIMLDTKGPEIRLKNFAENSVQLSKGQQFTLTVRDVVGDEKIAVAPVFDAVGGCRSVNIPCHVRIPCVWRFAGAPAAGAGGTRFVVVVGNGA